MIGMQAPEPDWKGVHTMLKPAELNALYHAAKDDFNGEGAAVDLGTWLGGSTVAMLEGLSRNNQPHAAAQVVHAYDKFELNAYLKSHYPMPELEAIPAGGSFLPVFEAQVAPWKLQVRTYAGDLNAIGWRGGPIELLHVDIMKTWPLANSVVKFFFAELIPGRSLIFHQDFVHFNTVWIHLLMHRFRDHFELVRHIPGTTTAVFRFRSAIAPEDLERSYGFADFVADEARAAFAWSRSLVDTSTLHHFNIDAAEAMLHVHKGEKDEARALLDRFVKEEQRFLADHPHIKGRSELAKVELALAKLM